MTRVLQAPRSWNVRNVHIYHDDGSILGGVYQNGSITADNFYDMCAIFLDFQGSSPSWSIFGVDEDGTTGALLPRDGNHLATGRYVVLSDNRAAINVVPMSRKATPRVYTQEERSSRMSNLQRHFRDEVRKRDCSCVMSGHRGDPEDPFTALDAVHIFPLARRDEWDNGGYANWITDKASASRIGENKMYSQQNGLLLNCSLHYDFVKYTITVNSNDSYKIIAFKNVGSSIINVDGQQLQDRTTNQANGLGVSDDALRWHFEQAVLAHMKGFAGEPPWDFDLGGGDEIGEIMEGPCPGERMEAELYTRLGVRDGVNMVS